MSAEGSKPGRPPLRALGLACLALALTAAALQREAATRRLRIDADEPIYIRLAFRYREMIAAGDLAGIVDFSENYEHPPLGKAVYSLPLAASGAPEPDWARLAPRDPVSGPDRPAFLATRRFAAGAGTLQCLAVALAHPVAGLMLADHSYHIKYTSEAYLEAVPGLLAILAVLLFERAPTSPVAGGAARGRLLLGTSAATLGLAVACKYVYGLVGVALLPFLLGKPGRGWRTALAFVAIASTAFVAADPVLWANPPARLWRSIAFHWRFAGTRATPLPWWTPLGHLIHLGPESWHIPVPASGLADRLLVPLSAFGLPWAWRRRPIWAAWAVLGLGFLLVWPTKWAQYLLLVLPPLAVCAGVGLEEAVRSWTGAWRDRARGPAQW